MKKWQLFLERGAGMVFLFALAGAGLLSHLGGRLDVQAAVRPAVLVNSWQLERQAIPTTATDLSTLDSTIPVGRDLYVCQLDVSVAPGTAAVNITIQDKQSPAVAMWNAIPITPASSTQGASFMGIINASADEGCRWFPGGVTISASGTGAVISMAGKY